MIAKNESRRTWHDDEFFPALKKKERKQKEVKTIFCELNREEKTTKKRRKKEKEEKGGEGGEEGIRRRRKQKDLVPCKTTAR